MRKCKLFLSIALFLVFLSSQAVANGLNLNSLGSRALSMGGAFVGLADDFSAIYWNPAGITQFSQKYFGFYGTDIIPSGKYKFQMEMPIVGTYTVVNAKSVSKHYLAGMVAYYHPLSEKLVAGLGVFVPSGLGAEWDGSDFTNISNGVAYDWRSKIGLVTIAPALAYKISDQFSIGIALNINYGKFDVAMPAGETEAPIPGIDLGQYEESMTGWGYGATIGILVKPGDKFSFGATFRTKSKVKFSGNASMSNLYLLGLNTSSDLDREVTWPMWLAGGIAFKPIEKLTLTADIQWTQWTEMDVMKTTYKDPGWDYMMAQSGDDVRPMKWRNATQIRFGAEYRINTIALRGGYYWDPSPAPDKTMNILLPNYDFNVLTLGFGYALDGLQIDVALEYLMGKERNIELLKTMIDPEWETAMPGTYNMKIVVPNVSISYRF